MIPKAKLPVLAFIFAALLGQTAVAANREAAFDQICKVVEDRFFDKDLVRERLVPVKGAYRKEIAKAKTSEEFAIIVNRFLGELKTSHTVYLTPADVDYYQLGAVFWNIPKIKAAFGNKPVKYPSLGIFTEKIEGKTFVSCTLAGGPADKAGILRGDEILAVDGGPFTPIQAIQAKVGKRVHLSIMREKNGVAKSIPVVPALASPKEELLQAQQESIRIVKEGGKKIGCIQIYSYAGEEYHEALLEAIAWGELKEADALILDIRYGLGGANPRYLNLFNKSIPQIRGFDRSGAERIIDSQWRKPAVYLVNGKTRSGKEILAFGAKKYQLATVIGEKTAGAVTGGALFPLENGAFLYLAVEGSKIDGEVLEGVGVLPDIAVIEDVRYASGRDRQLERAIAFLANELSERGVSHNEP